MRHPVSRAFSPRCGAFIASSLARASSPTTRRRGCDPRSCRAGCRRRSRSRRWSDCWMPRGRRLIRSPSLSRGRGPTRRQAQRPGCPPISSECVTGPCSNCSTRRAHACRRSCSSTSTTSRTATSCVCGARDRKSGSCPSGRMPASRSTPISCACGPSSPAAAGRPRGCSSARAARPCRGRARGRSSTPRPSGQASRSTFRRTRCGTRSRPTCCRAEPTCASCRSCSDTPRSRRPRSTRT